MKTILDSLYTNTRSFVSKISVLLILFAFPAFLTAQNVLFVVGDTLLDPGDQIIALSLQNEPGLSLEIVDDDGIQSSAANGKDLVLISSTTSAGKIGTTFTNTPTIVSCYNRELYDELGMVAPGGTGTVYESSIHLSDPSTPWWLKLTPVQVTNSTHPFTYATINGNATMHSHVPGNSNQALSFTYPSGSQMYGITAPADRVGLFLQDAYGSLIDLTSLGQTLLQASFGLTNPIQVEETHTFMKLYAPADTGLLRSGHGFQTSNGDYMVIGAGMSTDTIDNNFLLLELDDQGNQTAAYHFQTTALKEAVDTEFNVHNVAHTTDGDIVFVTQRRAAVPFNYPGPPDIGAAIIRLDENRNVKFLKTVSNSFFATPLALKATNDNGVVLLGYMPGGGLVYQKIDNQGVDVWEYTISESKKPKDLHIYPDGKMALIANENGNSYFMSFDTSGSWTSEIELQTSGMDDFELFAMEVLADSNLLLTGRARVNGKDMMPIIHISPQGVILDKRLISLGSYGDMRGTALVANPDGGFAVAGGVIDPFQSSKEKPFLIRFKDNLDLIEMQVYETFDHQANKHVATTDVELTSDWGYLITASQRDREYWKTTYGPLNHNGDGFPLLIKTDAKGQLKTPNDCKYTSFDNSNVSSYVLSSAGGSLGDITGVPVSYGQNPSSSKTVTTNPDLTYTEISLSSSVTNPQTCPMQLPECPTISLEFMTPDTTKNFIATYTPRVAIALPLGADAKTELQKLNYAHELIQSVTYADGLGRIVQQIAPQTSAEGADIISFSIYDGFNRVSKAYMPYETLSTYGNYQNSPQTDQQSFYTAKFPTYGTTRLFTEHQYEASQRSREVETAAPGVPWETKSSTTFGQRESGEHTVITSYDLNAAGEVHFIPLDVTPGTDLSTTYTPNELEKTTTIDEDEGISETFTDKMGKDILTRILIEGNDYAETYYAYDKYGNIIYVMPPEASKALFETGNGTLSQGILDSWCFQYEYDDRNRMTRKKVPGAGWVELIYNKLDQLVLTQDANQADSAQWLYTKYDAFARPIETGIYTSSNSKSALQGQVDAADLFEVRQSGNDGYSNTAFPTANTEKLSINYYDDYDFDRDGNPDHVYQATGVNEKSRGFITGVKTKVLNAQDTNLPDWLLTLTFYDDYGREIETRSEHLHGTDINKYQLNFIGEIEESIILHNGPNNHSHTQRREFCYDHNGRLLRIVSQVNNDAPIVLSSYEYNVLGKMISKKLNSKDGNTYLQDINFTHNIRGWITGINETPTSDDLFEMTLAYNDNSIKINGAGDEMFNGNVSGMSWKSILDNEKHGYSFSYDKLKRIKDANYGAGNGYSTNINRYSVDFSYDRNGNIKILNRQGKNGASSYGNMDHLVYAYKTDNGNRLASITDNGLKTELAGVEQFVDANGSGDDYLYDANGNITNDLNKGIVVEYNHLNRPTLVTKGGNSIIYVYDANGTKLQQIVNDGSITTNDYINNVQYENGSLQFFEHEEGRLIPDGSFSEYRYEFTIKDHLGNSRMIFSDLNDDGMIQASTEVLQIDHYYPFGMRMSMDAGIASTATPPNDYLYNGKELQTELEFNWYEYEERMYDASIGRFTGADPISDQFVWVSTYNYAENDPIANIDLWGLQARESTSRDPGLNAISATPAERQQSVNAQGQSFAAGGAVAVSIVYPKPAIEAGWEAGTQFVVKLGTNGGNIKEAFQSIDRADVRIAFAAGFIPIPGSGKGAIAIRSGTEGLKALVDEDDVKGLRVSELIGGEKSTRETVIDGALGFATSSASAGIDNSLKEASMNALDRSAFATLNKAEKELARKTAKMVNSSGFERTVSVSSGTVLGAATETVKEIVNNKNKSSENSLKFIQPPTTTVQDATVNKVFIRN